MVSSSLGTGCPPSIHHTHTPCINLLFDFYSLGTALPPLRAHYLPDTASTCKVIAMPPHCCCCLVAKSCLTLCDPMDRSPSDSSVHGVSQARLLEWVAISFSRGSCQPRDQTLVSCIGRWGPYREATREALPIVHKEMEGHKGGKTGSSAHSFGDTMAGFELQFI